MAFKGLAERFLAQQDQIYNRNSARTISGVGEPYIERKPNDPNNDLSDASRMNPGPAARVDVKRIGSYLTSEEGLSWLLNEQNQQSANTFGETRILQPLFVLGNVRESRLHIRRSLSAASTFEVTGNAQNRSPASSDRVGAAGRLQEETSLRVVGGLVSQSNLLKKLIQILPANQIITTIAGITQVARVGILGVDERPELDVNNDRLFNSYYSVALWQGFVKQDSGVTSRFDKAKANLRVGNIDGAINNIGGGIRQVVNEIAGLFGGRKNPKALVSNTANNALVRSDIDTSLRGHRYFITGKDTADRYLANSIDFNGTTPTTNLSFMHRRAYKLGGTIETVEDKVMEISNLPPSNIQQTKFTNALRDVRRYVQRGQQFLNALSTGVIPTTIVDTSSLQNAIKLSNTMDIENPAESEMLFPQRSLKNRYETDSRIDYIRSELKASKEDWQKSYRKNNLGFRSDGPDAGSNVNVDPMKKIKFGSGKYFSDRYNIVAVIPDTSGVVSSNTIQTVRRSMGEQLIDLFFYDTLNKRALPFRAFVEQISETVQPEIDDSTRYIGRIEKNVVYSGVQRSVTFNLRIHAFNETELNVIWEKINYLTGLCYPALYVQGFMVPTLVKLTLGDIYNNQPGYITSINYSVDEGMPWETDPGRQAPHGISAAITFNILEKTQVQSDSKFYNVGEPRAAGLEINKIRDNNILEPKTKPEATVELGELSYPIGFTNPDLAKDVNLPSFVQGR